MTRQFYMLPKELFESEDYQEMSLHAKVLYSLMRDRRSLSETNSWKDNGRTFIVFAQDNMCDLLGCKKDKVIKTLRELEEAELIERKIIGRKQPNYYYVEDAEQIQMLCEVSGLIKQDYLRKRALSEEFNIYPNSRVKKLLIKNLEEISLELKAKDNPSPTTWKRLNLLLDMIEKM